MQTVETPQALRDTIKSWRQAGLRIAFVPTMGNLHQGHLTLIKQAKRHADRVVASIFVNPMQFDRAEDLQNYPRTLEQDQAALSSVDCDLLFFPSAQLIYPRGLEQQTFVEVPGLSDRLEGALRPGHFRGVATIVTKLFNLVQPDVACFGEKDFQQLAVIRQMTSDLCMDIEIIGVPTVREADGLAMSSRNGYLTDAEKNQACAIYQLLSQYKQALQSGERNFKALQEQGAQQLNSQDFRTDSIDFIDADSLLPVTEKTQRVAILLAAFLGKARLIDNIVVPLQ